MAASQVIPSAVLALAFLATAWIIKNERLWSPVGNSTLPWLCSAFAVALLVIGFTALLSQRTVAEVPGRVSLLVTVALTLGLAVGNVVDVHYYYSQSSLAEALIESFGFGILLAVSFWIPRLADSDSKSKEA